LTVSTLAAQIPAGRRNAVRPDLVFVQAPTLQPGDLAERFPEGSRLVRLDRESAVPVNLTPDLFASADPQVSFDGSKILFAAKAKPASRWQVWEMNSDGSAKRPLTHCEDDCVRPAYLPRDEIVFTAQIKEGTAPVSQLYVSKRDGSEAHPITFGPGDFVVETVLQDGMILASARSPLLPASEGKLRGQEQESRELYTLRPDGSGLRTFRCDHLQPATRSEAAELDDGSLVFVKRLLPSRMMGGELAMIRRGALHNSPLESSSVAYSLKPLSGEKLVVACLRSPADRDPRAGNAAGKLALYAFDMERGKFTGLIYQDPKLSSLAAVPVAAHTPPRWYWSTLNPALEMGYFICLDSSLSDLPAQAGVAAGGRLPAAASKVRVLTLDPATRQERSLGEAPVEKDGSFYIAVPPDRPVRFELLEAGGRVMRAQRSWIWARSGEEHGCVGCHENRALAPENRWPLALHRLDTPVGLGVKGGSQAVHE
jgi:hypothetical protein